MDEYEQALAAEVYAAIQNASNNSPRSQQSKDFVMGISSIGFCPERNRRELDQQEAPETDKLAAFIGTAIGDHVERAQEAIWADAITQAEVVLTLRLQDRQIRLPGHPDVILPSRGLVLDNKSDFGLGTIEREGSSFAHLWQRNAYALAAWQMGMFGDMDLADIKTGNVYVDRAAIDKRVHVEVRPFDQEIIERGVEEIDSIVYAYLNDQEAEKRPPRQMCAAVCLAGETQVVTRQGLREIGDLAGGRHELLVPATQRSGLTWHGSWSECEVLSFGVQDLRRVTLTRRRQSKVVFATADHQWFLRDQGAVAVRTDDLSKGDQLRSIRKNNSGGVQEVPVAVLQGFTFGDGSTSGHGGNVSIFDNAVGKSKAMNPRFAGHRRFRSERDGAFAWTYMGLPSLWKEAPDFRESIPFLTSWLAGYVAADGKVDSHGKVQISSARREHIELVRSVCAVVGIGYGPLREEVRPAGRTKAAGEHTLYHVSLVADTLPEWFVLNATHRARLKTERSRRQAQWTVVSVDKTDRVEEVYCAVVPEVGAFALADDLLTHNCGFYSKCREWETDVHGLIEDPVLVGRIHSYVEGREMAKVGKRMQDEAKEHLRDMSGSTGEWMLRWVWTNGGENRAGSYKVDVSPVRKADL